MTQLGLDFAGGRPGGAAIKAAGYSFVCRYLTAGGPGLPGKLLTAAEYADLQAHGISVVVNWETTADRMKAGWAAGVADAKAAAMMAASVGHPTDRPILFSADFDAAAADQTAIDTYLHGAASVIGANRVGVYGSYYVCKRCLDNGTAGWAWQTMAWSGGQVEPRAHLVQRIGTVTVGGVPCDVNEACQLPDFGQHPCPTTPGGDSVTIVQLPRTPPPVDATKPASTWPQTEETVQLSYIGGWHGQCVLRLAVGHPGGYLYRAHIDYPNGTGKGTKVQSWIDPDQKQSLDLLPAYKQDIEYTFEPGAGPGTLMITYAAPGGASLSIEYEH